MKRIKEKCQELGITLNDDQINQFQIYYDMLIEKNKVMNLTAITELDDVIDKHFVDSLSLGSFYDLNRRLDIMDLGTGAGFPGIPLKIVYPDLNIVLLDSLKKRILFLDEVIEKLELQNIKAIHGRAEDYARQEGYRESFDLCVSRAVANLSTLSEYCMPYVKQKGSFISYKSGEIETEILESKHAVNIFGGKVVDVKEFSLPGTDIKRSFVVIEKLKKTPMKYPRKAGFPSKEPIR